MKRARRIDREDKGSVKQGIGVISIIFYSIRNIPSCEKIFL